MTCPRPHSRSMGFIQGFPSPCQILSQLPPGPCLSQSLRPHCPCLPTQPRPLKSLTDSYLLAFDSILFTVCSVPHLPGELLFIFKTHPEV